MSAPIRTFAFTDAGIRKLPAPPKPTQVDYFDMVQRGLGLRISYGGTRSFFVMYSSAGRRHRLGLGEYGHLEHGKLPLAVARKRARARLGEVATGKHPAAEARATRQAPTVRELARDFVEMQRARGRRSADKQGRMLSKDVLPAIGDRRAREVMRADVKAILKAVTARGAPIEANRIHEVVRAMFAYAIEEETYGIESNPAGSLGKHRNPEHGRERWLSLDEIARYWRALDEEPAGPAAALRLCLLTGARQGNVLGMRVDQISLADRMWIVPAASTKTARTYKIPLSRMACMIIEERLAAVPGPWLFPKRGGGGPACRPHINTASHVACRRAGIADYRLHDHRHTFATHCEKMGISRIVWDGILGHIGTGMADLYSGHDFAEQRLSCMERWADRIAMTLSDNVTVLHSA
jgi:integrase